jgi:hypothetical protein
LWFTVNGWESGISRVEVNLADGVQHRLKAIQPSGLEYPRQLEEGDVIEKDLPKKL